MLEDDSSQRFRPKGYRVRAMRTGGEEPEWSQRLRKLKMGDAESDGRESPSRRSFGVERDDLKWPAGEGWKRL